MGFFSKIIIVNLPHCKQYVATNCNSIQKSLLHKKGLKKWDVAKSHNSENCEKLHTLLQVSKSETLRKVITAKIAKNCTLYYKSQKVRRCEKSKQRKLQKIAHFITGLKKWDVAKSQNSENCKKLHILLQVSKSETSRKVKTAKIAKNCTLHYTAVIFRKVRPHKASEIEVGILPKVVRKAKISWKKRYADRKSKNPR